MSHITLQSLRQGSISFRNSWNLLRRAKQQSGKQKRSLTTFSQGKQILEIGFFDKRRLSIVRRLFQQTTCTQCLKITQKVSLHSLNYFQKLFYQKNSLESPKRSICKVLGKSVVCGQKVLPDSSTVNWTNVDGKCQNRKFKIRHFCRILNTLKE